MDAITKEDIQRAKAIRLSRKTWAKDEIVHLIREELKTEILTNLTFEFEKEYESYGTYATLYVRYKGDLMATTSIMIEK